MSENGLTSSIPEHEKSTSRGFSLKIGEKSQIEMLADMFLPSADPTSLSQEEKESLEEGVRNFLSLIANGFASPYDCELAEAFYAVKCGLGHFDDVQDRMMEILPNLTQDVEFH